MGSKFLRSGGADVICADYLWLKAEISDNVGPTHIQHGSHSTAGDK